MQLSVRKHYIHMYVRIFLKVYYFPYYCIFFDVLFYKSMIKCTSLLQASLSECLWCWFSRGMPVPDLKRSSREFATRGLFCLEPGGATCADVWIL